MENESPEYSYLPLSEIQHLTKSIKNAPSIRGAACIRKDNEMENASSKTSCLLGSTPRHLSEAVRHVAIVVNGILVWKEIGIENELN